MTNGMLNIANVLRVGARNYYIKCTALLQIASNNRKLTAIRGVKKSSVGKSEIRKMTSVRPYFFEEYFPSSYRLCYAPPVQRHPGKFDLPKDELEKAHVDANGFEVFVDVKDFQPDEISVKTINEVIVVEGKQEKRPGNSLPRHFVRHFHLPPFYDSEDVFSFISDDGILEIRAVPADKKKTKPYVIPFAEPVEKKI